MTSLSIVAEEAARYAPFAIAGAVAFRIANFPDLGIEGAFLVGGALTVWLSNTWGLNLYWILPLVLAVGALTGCLTAVLYLYLRIHPLFAGIITLMIAKSLGSILIGVDEGLTSGALYSSDYFGLLFAGSAVLVLLIFFSTSTGITFLMSSSSPKLFALLGGKPNGRLICLLAASSALAAIAGHFVVGITVSASRSMAANLLLHAIGWLLMGEAIIILGWRFLAACHYSFPIPRIARIAGDGLIRHLFSGGVWFFLLAAASGLTIYYLIFVYLTGLLGARESTEMVFAGCLAFLLLMVHMFGKRKIPLDTEWHFLGARNW